MAFVAALPAAIGTLASASTASAAALAAASTTVATATAATAAVTAGVTAYSSIKNSNFQSAIAKNNAQIAENNANAVRDAGITAESNKKLETGRRVGAALAQQGGSGVDVGSGSPSAQRGALQNEGDLDAATIRANAASAAAGYLQQSAGFSATSSLDKQAAVGEGIGGALKIGASYLGGATSVANKYSAFKLSGALS